MAMDDLPEPSDAELRNDPAALREVSESLGRRDNLVEESFPTSGAPSSMYNARIASRSADG